MQNNIQIFENAEFGKIRAIEIDGNPWFVGKDVASTLGYTNPGKALQDHVAEEDKLNNKSLLSLGQRGGWIINESGLYSLILSSKLPSAKAFKRWITSEVLPSIRRHGAYIHDEILQKLRESEEFAEELIESLTREKEKSSLLAAFANQSAPKVHYFDFVLQCPEAVQVSIIAKDYGMTAAAFNRLLHKLGIQFRVGKTWLLYSRYAGKGYTITNTYAVNGQITSIHTCFTQKGRLFLYETLKRRGILPEAEVMAGS